MICETNGAYEIGGFKVQVTSLYITRVPADMAAKTGRVEDVEKVQVDGLVRKMV